MTETRTIRIGTRGSLLARWQADWVADRLRALHPEIAVELVEIKTRGDLDRDSPLSAIGGMGIFTKEIQRALSRGDVDVAVHSLKDLPTRGPEGLILGAVPPREDVADALIAPIHKTLEALPPGSRVGTGSQRRKAQLLSLRPDISVEQIRGNVETRLNHAIDGRLDAVVLAEAGLKRLALDHRVTDRLAPPRFLPAVGQGALGIECRADDERVRALLAPLDDPATHRAARAERRVLFLLEGGCTIPLAAWATVEGGTMTLIAAVYSADGKDSATVSVRGDSEAPEALGDRAAQALDDRGAFALLGRSRPL